MKLFMFENQEHSAIKEISILNEVLDELNEDLMREQHRLSILENRYEWIVPMQYKYAIGTYEYYNYLSKINEAKNNYYNQFYKTQLLEDKINEVKYEMSLLN